MFTRAAASLLLVALVACNGAPEPLPPGTPFPVPRDGADVLGLDISTAMPDRWTVIARDRTMHASNRK